MEIMNFEHMPVIFEWSVRILFWTSIYFAYKNMKARKPAGTYDNGA